MHRVSIDLETLRRLSAIAHGRNDGKGQHQTRRMSQNFSDFQLDLIGVKGEFVVSQAYGVPFDESSYGAYGDDGVDVRTPHPGAIKTNHRTGGYLLLERWGDLKAVEVIHLVDGPCDPPSRCECATEAPQTWRYVGWITVPDFKERSARADWGLGPRRFMRQRDLNRGLYRGAR